MHEAKIFASSIRGLGSEMEEPAGIATAIISPSGGAVSFQLNSSSLRHKLPDPMTDRDSTVLERTKTNPSRIDSYPSGVSPVVYHVVVTDFEYHANTRSPTKRATSPSDWIEIATTQPG